MNINRIGFIPSNVATLNKQKLNSEVQNNSANPIKYSRDYNMPIIAPNYLANISFRGHLDWNAIAEYTADMGKRIYSKRNVTDFSKIHEGASGITSGALW